MTDAQARLKAVAEELTVLAETRLCIIWYPLTNRDEYRALVTDILSRTPDVQPSSTDEVERLLEAGNALAETIKMTKAGLVAGLTKRELGFLMDDLAKWNSAAIAAMVTKP
jgi:23S rRNA A2030 N6-methylase RlmJ